MAHHNQTKELTT
jgi:hypothetical protein